MTTIIDETAIIHPSVEIGKDTFIGPNVIIGKGCRVGDNTKINPNVIIKSNTTIGKNNKIFQFCSIGEDPQINKEIDYKHKKTYLIIGDSNTFRENVTIHRGSINTGDKTTIIGNNNFMMVGCHIAHDCKIGNDNIFANCTTFGGHVEVGDKIVTSSFISVKQFCKINSYCMLGAYAGITKDIPAFLMVAGHRGKVSGLNFVGMKRNGISSKIIAELKKAYLILYESNLATQEAINKIKTEIPFSSELKIFIESIENSKNGIIKYRINE